MAVSGGQMMPRRESSIQNTLIALQQAKERKRLRAESALRTLSAIVEDNFGGNWTTAIRDPANEVLVKQYLRYVKGGIFGGNVDEMYEKLQNMGMTTAQTRAEIEKAQQKGLVRFQPDETGGGGTGTQTSYTPEGGQRATAEGTTQSQPGPKTAGPRGVYKSTRKTGADGKPVVTSTFTAEGSITDLLSQLDLPGVDRDLVEASEGQGRGSEEDTAFEPDVGMAPEGAPVQRGDSGEPQSPDPTDAPPLSSREVEPPAPAGYTVPEDPMAQFLGAQGELVTAPPAEATQRTESPDPRLAPGKPVESAPPPRTWSTSIEYFRSVSSLVDGYKKGKISREEALSTLDQYSKGLLASGGISAAEKYRVGRNSRQIWASTDLLPDVIKVLEWTRAPDTQPLPSPISMSPSEKLERIERGDRAMGLQTVNASYDPGEGSRPMSQNEFPPGFFSSLPSSSSTLSSPPPSSAPLSPPPAAASADALPSSPSPTSSFVPDPSWATKYPTLSKLQITPEEFGKAAEALGLDPDTVGVGLEAMAKPDVERSPQEREEAGKVARKGRWVLSRDAQSIGKIGDLDPERVAELLNEAQEGIGDWRDNPYVIDNFFTDTVYKKGTLSLQERQFQEAKSQFDRSMRFNAAKFGLDWATLESQSRAALFDAMAKAASPDPALLTAMSSYVKSAWDSVMKPGDSTQEHNRKLKILLEDPVFKSAYDGILKYYTAAADSFVSGEKEARAFKSNRFLGDGFLGSLLDFVFPRVRSETFLVPTVSATGNVQGGQVLTDPDVLQRADEIIEAVRTGKKAVRK